MSLRAPKVRGNPFPQFGFIELFQIIVCTIVGTGVLLNFGMLAPGKH